MMKKIIPMTAVYVIIILIALCIYTVLTEDKDAPKIIYDNSNITYTEGEDQKDLLNGVKAVDAVDGDVTDTLTVESIRVIDNQKKANITYAAKDSKNNIAKVGRIVDYNAKTVSTEAQVKKNDSKKQLDENAKDKTKSNTIPDETGKSQDKKTEDGQNTKDTSANPDTSSKNSNTNSDMNQQKDAADTDKKSADESLDSTGKPVIKLKTNEVTIKAGTAFNPINYVKEAKDDKDDVWRRIIINGNYNTKVKGKYTLNYSVADSDGNHSNVEKLVVNVQ